MQHRISRPATALTDVEQQFARHLLTLPRLYPLVGLLGFLALSSIPLLAVEPVKLVVGGPEIRAVLDQCFQLAQRLAFLSLASQDFGQFMEPVVSRLQIRNRAKVQGLVIIGS